MTRALALVALLAAAVGAGVLVGGAALAPADVLAALVHPHAGGDVATIVWAVRLPRVAIAAVVGASLAIAGTLMQSLLRNPLVDPYLTGVSSGAGAAIAIAVALGVRATLVPALGFVAGFATAVIVAVLARRGTGLDAERLILAGVSISALMAAIVTLALTRLQPDAAEQIIAWLAGSLAGRGWLDLATALPYALVGVLGAGIVVPALNVLRLGERRAVALGLDLARTQWIVLASAALVTSAAVALGGLVGFVGLIVPHLARRILGSDLRVALPAGAALGAALVVVADAVSRSIFAPTELPLGVLLAFVGVPAFLVLYLRGVAQTYA